MGAHAHGHLFSLSSFFLVLVVNIWPGELVKVQRGVNYLLWLDAVALLNDVSFLFCEKWIGQTGVDRKF